jgi:hypothetical protein
MEIITLANRSASGRVPRGKFAEIFAHGDVAVQPIVDLASAVYKIRLFHPGGADLILIGMSIVQGMKMSKDSWGFISVLIGLGPTTLKMFSADDEVVVAFERGALRPAGVIGFLWDGSGPDSRPPESNSTLTRSRLDGIRHFRRLNLT